VLIISIKQPDYDGKAILRTSFETTKKIKQIRNLLNLILGKYYEFEIWILCEKIIEELISPLKLWKKLREH
jgi:hypothetical protein